MRRRGGAALLEAMLSVAIVSIGMLTAMRAIGFGASLQSRLERRAVGRRLAEQQLAVLSAQGSEALVGESSGQFLEPFSGYRWTVAPLPATERAPFTFVQLKVFEGQGDQQKAVYAVQTLFR